MGVYVKGMEMPETCIECMNSGLRTAIRCTEWTKISAGLRENHRAISCPLTEVPEPHGRLIDADALVETAEFYETEMELKKAKTVIEAEGELWKNLNHVRFVVNQQ